MKSDQRQQGALNQTNWLVDSSNISAGAMYDHAWNTLQRKFGQPHHIVSSQLAKIQNFSQIRFNDLALIALEFADTASSFVNILQQSAYANDFLSSSNLDIAIRKLPLDTKRRWFAFIESPARAMRTPNLTQFNEWLQEGSQIHERLLSSGPTVSKLGTPSSKSGKTFDFKKNLKSGESALSSNTDDDKTDSKCPLRNADNRIWNCEKLKNMKTQDRYDVSKEKRLCSACLSDNHAAKESPKKRNVKLTTVRRLTTNICITGRNLKFHQSL